MSCQDVLSLQQAGHNLRRFSARPAFIVGAESRIGINTQ
jgi:hypothetical protein